MSKWGGLFLMWFGGMMIGLSIGSYVQKNVIAAISDSGCNSHKQLHIEQEHKLRIDKYNLKKGFE